MYVDTATITFGDQGENHVGMQKIGKLADEGLSLEDLQVAKDNFEEQGFRCKLVDIRKKANLQGSDADEAYILIVRKGVKAFVETDELFDEQQMLDFDTKAFMYGRVVNKHARYNLCFSEESQEPNYEEGKGRIVSFDDVPLLQRVRDGLGTVFGPKTENLIAEGNYYYDVSKCGIGFHGDTERRIVVALRLGQEMSLHYQWYHEGERVGERVKLSLRNGDMYAMSEKAVGWDWKSKKIYTLRHAAGSDKFTA